MIIKEDIICRGIMKLNNKIRVIIICILCTILLTGCMNMTENVEESSKIEEEEDSLADIEKEFGGYKVPDDWYEDTKFMKDAFSYIKTGTAVNEPFDCVVVYADVNVYKADDHEVFRDAIVQQLPSLVPDGTELIGEGIYTKQGYACYIFDIVYAETPYPEVEEEYHRKIAYIVGENKHCMVEEIWFGEGAESHEVFQGILDSFVWNEE